MNEPRPAGYDTTTTTTTTTTKTKLLAYVLGALAMLAPSSARAQEPQYIGRVTAYTQRPNDVQYVQPSTTQILGPNQRLDVDEFHLARTPAPVLVQRLGERTYFLAVGLYAMTFYVGDRGVLLIDSGGHGTPDELIGILRGVAMVTSLPITTLVYSHPHVDHIGNAQALQLAMRLRGVTVRIIGSDRLVEYFRRYQTPLPMPTEVISGRRATFDFEGRTFTMVTPVEWGHSGADSYFLTPDRVLHAVDFVHAGRMPFIDVSGAQNMNGYIEVLRRMAGENWTFANWGHMNVGLRRDVGRALEYFRDLYDAWFLVIRRQNRDSYFAADGNSHTWLRNFFDQMSLEVFNEVRGRWGTGHGFEVARDHAAAVQWDAFLNYDFIRRPDIRPSFAPIPPDDGSVPFTPSLL